MSAFEAPAPAAGNPETFMCKSRLQEYTQKASMPPPVYQTITGHDKHIPHFRSQVWVDGTCFVSPNSYSNKKRAEQDAAKHALIGLREKIKNEGHLRILEVTVFCKSILNEYAAKMNMKLPTYATNETEAPMRMFVSSLQLNDVTYVGQAGVSKKEAEQSAARVAILSILGSESSTSMSEIMKSKFKLYDALQKVKESPIVQGGSNSAPDAVNPSKEDKKNEIVAVTGPSPAEIPQPCSLVPFSAVVQNVLLEPKAKAPCLSVHAFKKPKLLEASPLPSPSAIAPPLASHLPSPSAIAPPLASHLPSPPAIAPPLASHLPSPPAIAPPLASHLPSPSAIAPPLASHFPSPPAIAPPLASLLPSPSAIAPPLASHLPSSSAIAPPLASPSTIAPPPDSSVTMVPHIEFVPPASEQSPATRKKQNRKKRKQKKKGQLLNPTPIAMIPQSSAPAAFSMAQ